MLIADSRRLHWLPPCSPHCCCPFLTSHFISEWEPKKSKVLLLPHIDFAAYNTAVFNHGNINTIMSVAIYQQTIAKYAILQCPQGHPFPLACRHGQTMPTYVNTLKIPSHFHGEIMYISKLCLYCRFSLVSYSACCYNQLTCPSIIFYKKVETIVLKTTSLPPYALDNHLI